MQLYHTFLYPEREVDLNFRYISNRNSSLRTPSHICPVKLGLLLHLPMDLRG